MFVRLGKMVMVLALVATLGAHWALWQTVAWTTMLADNLRCCSFHDAVAKTFDGRHPCCLCKAIAAAKKSGKKEDSTAPNVHFEFPLAKENLVVIGPFDFQLLAQTNSFADSLSQEPPAPPPRACFV